MMGYILEVVLGSFWDLVNMAGRNEFALIMLGDAKIAITMNLFMAMSMYVTNSCKARDGCVKHDNCI